MRLFSPAGTAAIAALFGALNAIIRLRAGTRLAMDDAKTNLFTQKWQWGYQADNPPLYEWLIKIVHPFTGGGIHSFLVLKYLCLTAAAVFMHLAARRLLSQAPPAERERLAFAVAVGMVLLYQIGWNFHQVFTHSVLLVTMSCVCLYGFLRLVQERRTRDYALFGFILGIGILSKYNFLLLAVPLLAAGAVMPAFRGAVLDRRFILSLFIAGAIIAPHGIWLFSRADAYTAELTTTLALEGTRLGRMGSGLESLIVAAISFFLPFGLIAPMLLGGKRRVAGEHRLLLMASALSLAALFVGVVAVGIGNISERYVIPVLLPAYLAATALLIESRPQRVGNWFVACSAIALLVLVIRITAFSEAAPLFCEKCKRFVPFEALAAELAVLTPQDSVYVAYDEDTAGNLVAAFPEAQVRAINHLPFMNPTDGGGRPCFLVWSEELVGGLELVDVFAFAYDDPRTVMIEAQWPYPFTEFGERHTLWGVTPLTGRLYERFCTPGGKG